MLQMFIFRLCGSVVAGRLRVTINTKSNACTVSVSSEAGVASLMEKTGNYLTKEKTFC
jgi:hypothetical protein